SHAFECGGDAPGPPHGPSRRDHRVRVLHGAPYRRHQLRLTLDEAPPGPRHTPSSTVCRRGGWAVLVELSYAETVRYWHEMGAASGSVYNHPEAAPSLLLP